MFKFLKRIRKAERKPFELFLLERTREEPSLSLEDALNQYIRKYGLAVRHSLDEPTTVTAARTKLRILEESDFVNAEYCAPDEKFQHYLETLRKTVRIFDSLPPQVLKRMKEKEQELKKTKKAKGKW